MKKENLSKSELLKMIGSFEHYPAVTDVDDRGYILAYLDDEASSISQDDIREYLAAITITKDNIHFYYEFMSDEDLKKTGGILSFIFNPRMVVIKNDINFKNIDSDYFFFNSRIFNGKTLEQSFFGVKDTLKPIDEYIEEIKGSSEYKEYIYNNATCFNCKNKLTGMEILRIKQLNWQYGIKIDTLDFKYSLFCNNCKKEQERHNR